MKGEYRFQQHRVLQQSKKTTAIGSGIEKIRIVRSVVTGAHEPRLQQRIIGGESEERQTDRYGKQTEQPKWRHGCGGRVAPTVGYCQWQRQRGGEQKNEVNANCCIS